jgi:hypothetical protein
VSGAVIRLVTDDEVRSGADSGVVDLLRRRIDGTYDLDAWGLDVDATHLAGRLAALRWSVTVSGIERVPAGGPALLVANRRLGWSEPAVVASAVTRETGRIVRPVGGVDLDPVGGLLRRLGALPARPEEVAAALRAGNLVLVPTRREPLRNRSGHLPIELLAPAVAARIPIVPVAVAGWELGRRWSVTVGDPIVPTRPSKARAGTRADARSVGRAAVEVSASLDAMLTRSFDRSFGARVLSLVPSALRPRGDDSYPGGD